MLGARVYFSLITVARCFQLGLSHAATDMYQ